MSSRRPVTEVLPRTLPAGFYAGFRELGKLAQVQIRLDIEVQGWPREIFERAGAGDFRVSQAEVKFLQGEILLLDGRG